MRVSQRNFVSLAIIIILVLIVINLLSYTPPSDETSAITNNSAVMITESTHDFKQFKKEIEALTAMHHAHQNEINSLKDTITNLQQQISDNQLQTVLIKEPQKSSSSSISKSASGAVFELIPENEIIYPLITISNKDISDTPSSPNSIILKDMNGDSVIYETENGVIHGNPLLIEECANALTIDHEVNILSSIAYFYNAFVPWFWSRESIGSVLSNQAFDAMSRILTTKHFNNLTNAVYVEIDNSASQIVQSVMLKSTNLLQTIESLPNNRIQSKCGFTFVQHPITRFISGCVCCFVCMQCICVYIDYVCCVVYVAYFKVNVLLWTQMQKMQSAPDFFYELTFYKISGDLGGRLKAFVNDLRKYHHQFVELFPFMSVLRTQSGQLSFSQIDIDHIFKYEFIEQEYFNILSDPNDQFCIDESDDFVFNDDLSSDDERWRHSFGVNKNDLLDVKFREWMGLKIKLTESRRFEEIDDLVKMDILYVYDAINYEVYSKIVEYYWQDFVCFDYAADYKRDVLDYLTAFQQKYDGFPVKNRTKTNWDLILDFYYSKENKHRQ